MILDSLQNERRVEQILSKLLTVCLIISVLIVLVGGILYMVRYGGRVPEYHSFLGEPKRLRSVPIIVRDVLSLHSRSIIQFGLLLLMITPVTWVVFLFIAFVKQRDLLYSLVSLIVFGILIYSFAGGSFW